MTGVILKLLVVAFVFWLIYSGVRRIWRDWTRQFRVEEKQIHARDLKEHDAPGVITLERGKDGTRRVVDVQHRPDSATVADDGHHPLANRRHHLVERAWSVKHPIPQDDAGQRCADGRLLQVVDRRE